MGKSGMEKMVYEYLIKDFGIFGEISNENNVRKRGFLH
jgi:hypothetical protein